MSYRCNLFTIKLTTYYTNVAWHETSGKLILAHSFSVYMYAEKSAGIAREQLKMIMNKMSNAFFKKKSRINDYIDMFK